MTRKILNQGKRKDFYLSIQNKNGKFIAYFTDFERMQYHGIACKYKRLSSVVKYAIKYNFLLMED